ncbi:hypothetical protein B224_6036 [Aeromonas media WS]|nr:hypothetical protein B224_6036 [Aeromonas media WS]
MSCGLSASGAAGGQDQLSSSMESSLSYYMCLFFNDICFFILF